MSVVKRIDECVRDAWITTDYLNGAMRDDLRALLAVASVPKDVLDAIRVLSTARPGEMLRVDPTVKPEVFRDWLGKVAAVVGARDAT